VVAGNVARALLLKCSIANGLGLALVNSLQLASVQCVVVVERLEVAGMDGLVNHRALYIGTHAWIIPGRTRQLCSEMHRCQSSVSLAFLY
jgi:hypothetical protein